MSNIIGKVGRRSLKIRVMNISIHVILLIGAATMIYPFLVMLSGSVKSDLDNKRFTMLPRYFYDDDILFQKYLLTKYNDQTTLIKRNLKENCATVEKVTRPEFFSQVLIDDLEEFLTSPPKEFNYFFYGQGMVYEKGVNPLMLRQFRSWLQQQYGSGEDGLFALNKAVGSEFSDWENIKCPYEDFFERRWSGNYKGFLEKFLEFKEDCSGLLSRYYFDIDGYFLSFLLREISRDLDKINTELGTDFKNFQQVTIPSKYPSTNPPFAELWERFVRKNLNLQFIRVNEQALIPYRTFLKERYGSNISFFNKAYGKDVKSFNDISLLKQIPKSGNVFIDWNDFISEKAPITSLRVYGLGYYYRQLLKRKYQSLSALNSAYQRGYSNFNAVALPETMPKNNITLKGDWNDFLKTVDPKKIKLKRSSIFEYRNYLKDIYRKEKEHVDYSKMSFDYNSRIAGSGDVPAFQNYPAAATSKAKTDYKVAVNNETFVEMRVLKRTPEMQSQWVAFLKERYHGEIQKLNSEYGLLYTSFSTAPIYMKEYEWGVMNKYKSKVFWEFVWRNYAMVIDTVLLNGHAAVNTIIYCALAILAALIVNPLAAYALSRYNPPSTYKLLLLLMLTMAFPPMVLGIPNFLMIKKLGLLNTFAALVLPGMASGYSIFLLKGFFDSLPKELFECATLDGASEAVMFRQIAMTLSKPILAVIALQTFMLAYGNFMMAFILCQNPKMWTLMVYLYQLQQRSSISVGFAALVIAAIPTFLVFVFCQNIIIKGIVVPTEK